MPARSFARLQTDIEILSQAMAGLAKALAQIKSHSGDAVTSSDDARLQVIHDIADTALRELAEQYTQLAKDL